VMKNENPPQVNLFMIKKSERFANEVFVQIFIKIVNFRAKKSRKTIAFTGLRLKTHPTVLT